MSRKILIGIAGAVLALVIAAGAAFAGPALVSRASTAPQTAATAAPNTPQQGKAAREGLAARLVRQLVKQTADVTGTQPKDVLAALGGGKSLAQYAQDHGKTANDVVKAARAQIQGRLSQSVTDGKITQAQADALLAKFDQAAPKVMADANLGQQIARVWAKKHPRAAGLIKATAEATGTQPKDVVAALRQGQSLAQYAQAHGKTADDILAKLKDQGEQRLGKALDRAKDLINKPGLGRDGQPEAAPTEGAGR